MTAIVSSLFRSNIAPRTITRNEPLFSPIEDGKNRWSAINIQSLNQESFLKLVARNSVQSIIDIRPVAVFEAPRFQHKPIIHNLRKQNVEYIEYSILLRDNEKVANPVLETAQEKFSWVARALQRGLVLLVQDDETEKLGWQLELRSTFKQFGAIELHRSSLLD